MGEAAKALLNVFGFTGLFFGFISNISVAPYISLAIGIISTAWAFVKLLIIFEDWKIKRAKRREQEYDTRNKISKK